jgi:hypothetical protein
MANGAAGVAISILGWGKGTLRTENGRLHRFCAYPATDSCAARYNAVMVKNNMHPQPGPLDGLANAIWPVLSPLYNFRNILYGLLFLAYVRLVHPRLLDLLSHSRETGTPFVFLGLVLLGFQLWELAGIWLKLPLTQQRIREQPNPSVGAKLFVGIAQLSHLFLALVILNNILPLFGLRRICFDYDTRFVACALSTGAFLAVVIKELVILILIFREKEPTAYDLYRPLVKIREMAGEAFLLTFGMVGFTLSWNGLLTTLDPAEAVEPYVIWIVGMLLFMVLYPASRMVFTMEAWLVKQPWLNRLLTLVFFLITLAASLAEVPGLL